ncbi:hypothetical protein BP5796_09080 [Coleophoma crateriformis]|uniref:F-box domain-containing protein n=1 Tax=Coleophoma crateriformis TaxID=565419 RepID=A0A3D8R2Z9_9HELO|nr:hypothetical protein BP5796_09080 [Coleophoma crateriformis]
MTSDSRPPADSSDNDHLLDLENIFSHPAGLRTARYLVGAFVKSAADVALPSSQEVPYTAEGSGSPTHPCPLQLKEPGALKQLLSFKQLERWREVSENSMMADRERERSGASVGQGGLHPQRGGNPYANMYTTSTSECLSQNGFSEAFTHDLFSRSNQLLHAMQYQPQSHEPESSITSAARALVTLPRATLPQPYATNFQSIQRLYATETSSTAHDQAASRSQSEALPGRPSTSTTGNPNNTLAAILSHPHSTLNSLSSSNDILANLMSRQSSSRSTPDASLPASSMESLTSGSASLKRKETSDGSAPAPKKKKADTGKAKRVPKPKAPKDTAASQLPKDIWMRILEFTPPRFLAKVRLVDKIRKELVDQYDSIYVNCRKENFGHDMPSPPEGVTERQYSNLLEGKGCQIPECPHDTEKMAARTHWSWSKRWCMTHWKEKVIREDRLLKIHASTYPRTTLTRLLECIPVGMQDSFVKPHDFVEDVVPRPRGAPRLYKVYLHEDVDNVFAEYEALTPEPYQENPEHSAEEKTAAAAAWQAEMDALPEKQNAFFAERKAKTDEHMAKVVKIEAGIRSRRGVIRKPHAENRAARKALFTKRAGEDLPNIPEEFVKSTKAFKAATRVFRDPGSERGWLMLKPKIEKEWEDSLAGGGRVDAAFDDESATNTDSESGGYSRSASPRVPSIQRAAPTSHPVGFSMPHNSSSGLSTVQGGSSSGSASGSGPASISSTQFSTAGIHQLHRQLNNGMMRMHGHQNHAVSQGSRHPTGFTQSQAQHSNSVSQAYDQSGNMSRVHGQVSNGMPHQSRHQAPHISRPQGHGQLSSTSRAQGQAANGLARAQISTSAMHQVHGQHRGSASRHLPVVNDMGRQASFGESSNQQFNVNVYDPGFLADFSSPFQMNPASLMKRSTSGELEYGQLHHQSMSSHMSGGGLRRPSSAGRFNDHPMHPNHHQRLQQASSRNTTSSSHYTTRLPISDLLGPQTPSDPQQHGFKDFSRSFAHQK